MVFIDIHAHLEMGKDVSGMIENAKKKNVSIVTCGVDVKSNKKALEIAEKYPEVKVCLGIYPVECLKMSDEEIDSEIEFIRQNKDKIIGIGEVGLDLKKAKELDKQKKNLVKFVNLAKELDIPILIHSRQAEADAIELLEEIGYNRVIMHCFSGKFNLVDKIIENKWYLSIPTNVKHSSHFQEVIEVTPIEQLFCETDTPFLHPDKKFPNEPSNIIESYKKIAEIKGLSLEEVEKQVEENFNMLF